MTYFDISWFMVVNFWMDSSSTPTANWSDLECSWAEEEKLCVLVWFGNGREVGGDGVILGVSWGYLYCLLVVEKEHSLNFFIAFAKKNICC
jgi:hypothetical protein